MHNDLYSLTLPLIKPNDFDQYLYNRTNEQLGLCIQASSDAQAGITHIIYFYDYYF